MKKLFTLILVALLLSLYPARARADIPFDKNLLINDSLFIDHDSMTVQQIQDFLDSEGNLLANWVDNVDMRRPSDNCVVHKATGMTAAEIIYEASTGWNAQIVEDCAGTDVSYWGDADYSNYTMPTVSPKVLLVTLQKEQSLISTDGTYSTDPNAYKNPVSPSNEYKLARATGYGVPDSGSINEQYLGFYNQINWSSWQLRYNFERSAGNTDWDEVGYKTFTGPFIEGTWKRCATCTPEVFDGYYPIDGSPLYMDNRATASLYYYTPHTYPGYYGNYNFVQFYNDWFGSPYTNIPYAFSVESIEAFTDSGRSIPFSKSTVSLPPGQKAYLRVVVRNMGYKSWTKSTLKLGTSNPFGRRSVFYDTSWNSTGRVTNMAEASAEYYDLATFEYEINAPLSVGSYTEYFTVVWEGVTWMTTEPIYYRIDVLNPSTTSGNNMLPSGSTLLPGRYLLSADRHSILLLKNDQNLTLFSDSKPTWSANTKNTGASRLVMQGDGNLVLYNDGGVPKWNSETNGNPGAYLLLKTNGNLVIYDSTGTTKLWESTTSVTPDFTNQVDYNLSGDKLYPGQLLITANRKYRLVLQSDGNLVLYGPNGYLWAAHRYSSHPSHLSMQSDGNLVLYDTDGKPYWNSGTNTKQTSSKLLLQQDGNLVIYNGKNKPVWNTNTHN